MQKQLTLSRNSASCTSTWNGYRATAVETAYSTPTWDYDNITITVPGELDGATFNAVQISYNTGTAGGTAYIQYSDTRKGLNNASLLERLQAGDKSIRLLFSYRAAGGSGGVGSHSSTYNWTNISISVDYVPAGKINGSSSAGTHTVSWAFKESSVALDESGSVTLSVTPSEAATGLALEVRPHGASASVSTGWTVNAPAGISTTVQGVLSIAGLTLSARVVAADIRVTVSTASGSARTAWISTSLKLVRERLAPVVAVSFSDVGDGVSKVGAYVQGRTVLRAALSVTLDTEADADAVGAVRTVTMGGTQYAIGSGNTVDIATDELQDSVAWTASVTDGYGKTGSASGTVAVLPYSQPVLSALSFERYVKKTKSTGEEYYELSDDGALMWVNATGGVSALNGRNAWSMTAQAETMDEPAVMASGDDGRVIGYTQDRTLFTVQLASTAEHEITVVLTDKFGSVTYKVAVPKAGGIFSVELYGVAVGKRATGTETARKFECAWPAVFEDGIFDADGKAIGGAVYTVAETVAGEFMGKTLYRKVVTVTNLSTSSDTPSNIDAGLPGASLVRIDGMVHSNNYGDLPANCYHSGTIRAFARFDRTAGKVVAYTGSANTGAEYILEYTKE